MTSDVMMREVSGVIHNSTLLKVFNDAIGKEVLVETVDGSQFKGILAGVSPEITDIGLIHAHKVTPENEKNLLPKKSEVESKIQFKYEHVVCWSVVIVEDKLIKGFATDRSYHNKNGMTTREEDELVAWEGDEGEDGIDIEEQAPTHRAPTNNGGWGVEEMFNANKKMGVTSTFDENLSQYTTAEVIDDPQGRARAEQIAREIESGSKSKIHSLLENDDEERDLDKETCEEDFEIASRKRGQLARAGRQGNTLPATNRRAEGMKGGINRDRVNGGSGRYPANINNNYGTPNGKGGQAQQEWKESGSRRENRENRQVDNNAAAAAPKKTHLENKSSGSPRNQDGASRRVEDLKEWGGEFNKTFQAPREGSADKPDEPGVTPSPSSAHARQSTGNAWTRGPPSSLLNSSHHVSSPSSTSPLQSAPLSSGPPSEPSEPSPTNKEEPRKEEDEKQENAEQNTSVAHDDQMASTSQDDSLSKPPGDPKPNDENSSGSKFKFNLAAQPFVPKSVQPQQAQPVAVSSHQMPPQTAIPTAVPLSAVPVQAPIAAPPMLMQSGGMQPPVVVYPQPVYQAAPQYYGQQMVVRTQSGQPVPQMMTHQNPAHAQQRRPPQTPMVLATQPAVYPTATAQMYQHPSGGYYTTGSYAQTSVPPPQQQYISQVIANAGGQPVAVSYVPQQPQQQQQQQQRYLAQQAQAQMGYAMPPTSMSAGGNARYPVQQQSAPAHDYQGQGNQTGQPVSQPPTPGPQGHPQPSQSVPPPPPPSHPSAAPSPRTFSPHPHQGGVGMQPTVSAPQPHQFYVHSTHPVQAPVYYPGAMYYQPHATAAQMQHMQAQAAQQQGNTPPQQHPGMQQGDQQHEMPAQYMSQEQYQQFIQQQQQQQQQQHQQGNYYQGPPPGHMRQGSLPPQQQQQQYVAQQPPQGMPLQGQPGPSQQAQGGPPPNQ